MTKSHRADDGNEDLGPAWEDEGTHRDPDALTIALTVVRAAAARQAVSQCWSRSASCSAAATSP